MTSLKPDLERAAAAIANARGGRRGAPPVSNVLELLKHIAGGKLLREVQEDAQAALLAWYSRTPGEKEVEAVAIALSLADPDERGLPEGETMAPFYRKLVRAVYEAQAEFVRKELKDG